VCPQAAPLERLAGRSERHRQHSEHEREDHRWPPSITEKPGGNALREGGAFLVHARAVVHREKSMST
jgi:hypothetical protein